MWLVETLGLLECDVCGHTLLEGCGFYLDTSKPTIVNGQFIPEQAIVVCHDCNKEQ